MTGRSAHIPLLRSLCCVQTSPGERLVYVTLLWHEKKMGWAWARIRMGQPFVGGPAICTADPNMELSQLITVQ